MPAVKWIMSKRRLVVLPSDPIYRYEEKGLDWMERYYNPLSYFSEVYSLNRDEPSNRCAYGMFIQKTSINSFNQQIKQINPHAIRAYGGYVSADLAAFNDQINIPVITSLHDPDPRRIHKSVKYSNFIICTSEIVKRSLLNKLNIPEHKIGILPNRVDRSIFKPLPHNNLPRHAPDLPTGAIKVLHIGRHSQEKNLDTVIKSISMLPDWYHLIAIGQGNTQHYQKIADESGIASRCHWISSVSNSELPQWHAWADCLCNPSRWEGFGNVFIEAAACGQVIITSNIEPMSGYFRNGLNAMLVDQYEQAESLASMILTVSSDQELRNRLIENSPLCAKEFDLAAVDQKEVDIYEAVINGDIGDRYSQYGKRVWRGCYQLIDIVHKSKETIKKCVRPVKICINNYIAGMQ